MVKHICFSGIAAKTTSFISLFHHPCQSELTVGETTQNRWGKYSTPAKLVRTVQQHTSSMILQVMGMMSSVTVLWRVFLLFFLSVLGAGTQALSGGCRAITRRLCQGCPMPAPVASRQIQWPHCRAQPEPAAKMVAHQGLPGEERTKHCTAVRSEGKMFEEQPSKHQRERRRICCRHHFPCSPEGAKETSPIHLVVYTPSPLQCLADVLHTTSCMCTSNCIIRK